LLQQALGLQAGVPEGSNLPLAELFRRKYGMQAGTIIGSGSFVPDYVPPDHATGLTPNATPYWMTGGSAAEVEVDTETGHVRVPLPTTKFPVSATCPRF
jgi:hypothetical protein